MTMMMEITMATMGRLIKNLDIVGINTFRLYDEIITKNHPPQSPLPKRLDLRGVQRSVDV